jgi:hypothetical protein
MGIREIDPPEGGMGLPPLLLIGLVVVWVAFWWHYRDVDIEKEPWWIGPFIISVLAFGLQQVLGL